MKVSRYTALLSSNQFTTVLYTEQVHCCTVHWSGTRLYCACEFPCCIMCSAIHCDCYTVHCEVGLMFAGEAEESPWKAQRDRGPSVCASHWLTWLGLLSQAMAVMSWGWIPLYGSPANLRYTLIMKYIQTRVAVVSSSWKNHLWRFFSHPDQYLAR